MNQDHLVKRLLSLGDHRLRLYQDVTALTAHPDGKSFFTASETTTHQWSVETGELIKLFYVAWHFDSSQRASPVYLAPAEEKPKQPTLLWSDLQKLIEININASGNMKWLEAPKGKPFVHISTSQEGNKAVLQKSDEVVFWTRDASGSRYRFSLPSQANAPCAWIFLGGDGFLLSTQETLQCYRVQIETQTNKPPQYTPALSWEVPCRDLEDIAMLSEKTAALLERSGVLHGFSLESGSVLWSKKLPPPKSNLASNNKGLFAIATEEGAWVFTQEGDEKCHIKIQALSRTLLALSSLGDWVVLCPAATKELRLFALPEGAEKFPKDGHLHEIKQLAWLGSKLLSTAQGERVVRRWSLSSSSAEWLFEMPPDKEVAGLFPLPDASGFLCRHTDQSIALYSSDGELQREIPQELSQGSYLYALSLDGARFYLAKRLPSEEHQLCVFSVPDWREQKRYSAPRELRHLVPIQGGVLRFVDGSYSLLQDKGEEGFEQRLPSVYRLRQVLAVNQEEAVGMFSWCKKKGSDNPFDTAHMLRRWNLKTGQILWSTQLPSWGGENRFLVSVSPLYIATYETQQVSFYSLQTGLRIESQAFSGDLVTSAAGALHQSFLAVGGKSGAALVYDASGLTSSKEPLAPKDQDWVLQFFSATTPEERLQIFDRFWKGLSPVWKKALVESYPPIQDPEKSEPAYSADLLLLEGFLRDELEIRICGHTVEVEAVPDLWANPEGYPNTEYVYLENNTLEPLRYLQNVISLDCSISRVTSLEPVRGLPKLKRIETKGCDIQIK